MAEQSGPDIKFLDPVEMSRMMSKIAEQSQRLVQDFLARQSGSSGVRRDSACPIRSISARPSST